MSKRLAERVLSSLEPGQTKIDMGCYHITVDQFKELTCCDHEKGSFGNIGSSIYTWPDGIVRYSVNPVGIAEGSLDPNGIPIVGREQLLQDAMEEISSAAQIQFVEVPFGTQVSADGISNYIEFQDDPDAEYNFSTLLGTWPIPHKQEIHILNWHFGVIVHEICHALGMIHEQNRSDRESYVDIIEDNIVDTPSALAQFAIVTNSNNAGTDYDFLSIMHYGYNYFAKAPGLTTIEPLPQYQQFKFQMAQRNGLTDTDKAALADIYGSRPVQSTPGVSPPPGTYEAPLSVNLVIADPNGPIYGGAFFRYTLDGTDPTEDSNPWEVDQSVVLNNSVTLKWRGFHPQRQPSIVGTAGYTLSNAIPLVNTPSIAPPGGFSNGPQPVSITTTTPGADIYYTENGTTPNQSSTPYTGTFTLNQSTTVRAKAYKAGHTPSDVATASFTIEALQIPPPTLSPPEGEYAGSVAVTIDTNVALVERRYTLDNTEPNQTDSYLFDGDPIYLFQDTIVKAKLFRDGFTPSETVTAEYTVIEAAPAPDIDPNGGNHTGSVDVTLSIPAKSNEKNASTPNEHIYYTTNDADPQPFSNHYDGTPFTLEVGSHTVKARTIVPGLPPSAITEAQFTVYDPSPTLDPPEFLPRGRDHANSVEVTIQNFTEDSDIYYTVGDNVAPSDPTTGDTLYSGPFTLGLPTGGGDFWFIRAKAFKGAEESALVPKTYKVFDPIATIEPPTFDPPANGPFYNPITVEFSTTTDPVIPGPNTGIRFFNTTNGDPPTAGDPPSLGNDSVQLDETTLLKAIAYRDLIGESNVASASYTFKCASPTIIAMSNKEVHHYGAVTVVMDSTTTGGSTTIRYATGGVEPDENSTAYTDPIDLGVGTHIFKAKTYRDGFEDSETTSAAFIVEETPEAPVITENPIGQTIDQYADVTFAADATGVPTPEFQWQFDGQNMAGETLKELYIPSAQPGHAGEYRVVVSNSAGDATSTAAVLVVNATSSPTPTATLDGPTPTATHTATSTATVVDGGATATPTPTSADGTETPTPTATEAVPVYEVVVVDASQDNTLFETVDGSLSSGAGPHLYAGRVGGNGANALRRALVAFDVSSVVPAGSTIRYATLMLNMSKSTTGTETTTIHRVSQDWGEGTSNSAQGQGAPSASDDATWLHTFFNTLTWTAQGGDFETGESASQEVSGVAKYSWGSSAGTVADVQSWLDDPSTNYGWAIVGDESGPTTKTVKQYDSKEDTTAENRPALAVEYSPPVVVVDTPTPTVTPTATPTSDGPTATPTSTSTDEVGTPTPTSESGASPTPTETSDGVDPTPTNTSEDVSIDDADVNGDGIVNEADLLWLLRYWMQTVN